MATGGEQEGMDDQVCPLAGCLGLAHHLWGDGEDVLLHRFNHTEGIRPGVIEFPAQFRRVAGQRHEGDIMLRCKIGKATRPCQPDGVPPGLLKPDRQRQEGLEVTARAVGEQGDMHGSILSD